MVSVQAAAINAGSFSDFVNTPRFLALIKAKNWGAQASGNNCLQIIVSCLNGIIGLLVETR